MIAGIGHKVAAVKKQTRMHRLKDNCSSLCIAMLRIMLMSAAQNTYLLAIAQVILPRTLIPIVPEVLLKPNLQVESRDMVSSLF